VYRAWCFVVTLGLDPRMINFSVVKLGDKLEEIKDIEGKVKWNNVSTRVEAHDEVVTFGVSGLVFRGDPGQAEGAPVGVAANLGLDPRMINFSVVKLGDKLEEIKDIEGKVKWNNEKVLKSMPRS
jgi:Fe-S-cluster formation regulator IscX/YfhJ